MCVGVELMVGINNNLGFQMSFLPSFLLQFIVSTNEHLFVHEG